VAAAAESGMKMASAIESSVSAARQIGHGGVAAASHRQQWRRNGNQRGLHGMPKIIRLS
jgi:hypothetical protein